MYYMEWDSQPRVLFPTLTQRHRRPELTDSLTRYCNIISCSSSSAASNFSFKFWLVCLKIVQLLAFLDNFIKRRWTQTGFGNSFMQLIVAFGNLYMTTLAAFLINCQISECFHWNSLKVTYKCIRNYEEKTLKTVRGLLSTDSIW
jgi:hypothetical protein